MASSIARCHDCTAGTGMSKMTSQRWRAAKVVIEGAERGASSTFVQADYVDAPAIALYEKFGAREKVLHFEIKSR